MCLGGRVDSGLMNVDFNAFVGITCKLSEVEQGYCVSVS